MRIQAVLFDGYGTLFEDAMGELMASCAQIVREQGLEVDAKGFLDVWDGYFFSMIRGGAFFPLRVANRLSLERAFEELQVNAEVGRYVDSLFERFGRCRTYADVRPALERLKGYATGVVSNADSDHLDEALKRNGLRFPVVVSSESARCYKPKPGIFQEALDLMGCKPEEALYVGDSQEDDIVGARRAEMRVAWLNRRGEALKAETPRPDYEIRSLQEVPGIV